MAWTDFLSSSSFQNGAGAGASYLQGQQQAQQSAAQIQNTRDMERARLLAQALSQQSSQQLTRDTTGVGLNDPSKIQNWRQSQAVKSALMPGIRQPTFATPANLQGRVPTMQGGFQIPTGGFSPETLAFFSPDARMSAEQSYWQAAAPFTAPPDFTQVGYGNGATATNANASMQAARTSALTTQQTREQQQTAMIQKLLEGNPADEGSGWTGILGAILSALAGGLGKPSAAKPGAGANTDTTITGDPWTYNPSVDGNLASYNAGPGAFTKYPQAPSGSLG
jgi:hypothetical protein